MCAACLSPAVAEQLALGEALRKRIEGKRHGSDNDEDDSQGGSDSENESTDVSDREGGARPQKPQSNKAKLAALEVLAGRWWKRNTWQLLAAHLLVQTGQRQDTVFVPCVSCGAATVADRSV